MGVSKYGGEGGVTSALRCSNAVALTRVCSLSKDAYCRTSRVLIPPLKLFLGVSRDGGEGGITSALRCSFHCASKPRFAR